MKKRALWLILALSYSYTCTAQFYDRAWLVGWWGDIKLTYQDGNTSPDTSTFITNFANQIKMTADGSNVSDSSGKILFYANTAQVANATGYLMDNGDNIYDSIINSSYPNGIPVSNSNLILPKSGNQFYLFNISFSDSILNIIEQADRIYYSIIDMDSNGGLGKVISKRNMIWHSKLVDDSRLTACRHANGRDWWLIAHGLKNDEFISFLVTPDSVYPPSIQHLGPIATNGYAGQSVFSSDGRLFASVSGFGAAVVMSFDRCLGRFSYIDTLILPTDTVYSAGRLVASCGTFTPLGCSFSPSGRYLYVSTQCYLMQFDMQATNISNSGVMVVHVDTSEHPLPLFNNSFLMPNNQIVMCSWEYGPPNFHLVQYPDSAYPACRFQYYGLKAGAITALALPNMVNYRMGALRGSSCDTLRLGNNELTTGIGVHIYPNPATDRILVGLPVYIHSPVLFIYDALGKEVYRSLIYLDKEIDVSQYPQGVYYIRIASPDGNVSSRFVKE